MDRVLVTGATGFLGGALTKRLLGEGHTVAVVQRPQSPSVDSRCTRIEWSGEATQLVDAIERWTPEIIFHLATHFVSQHRTGDLPALMDANIALGATLLEAAHKTGSMIVITGSAWQHFGGAPYSPVSLYAATKQALFDIAVYYKQSGVDVRELSFFDTYGPRDNRGKIVSLLLNAALTSDSLDMSSGDQLIDLLFVADAVDAVIATASASEPESIDVARFIARSGQPMTIKTLVSQVRKTIDRPLSIHWGVRPDRTREMTTNWEFGIPVPLWSPKVSLGEGISECWKALSDEHRKSDEV